MADPEPIPYERFKEVNDARAALEKQLADVTAKFGDERSQFEKQIADLNSQAAAASDQLKRSGEDLATAQASLLRVRVAVQNNLPLEFAERLHGATEPELVADAKQVAALLKPASPGVPPPASPAQPAVLDVSTMTPAQVRENSAKILAQARAART